MSCISPPMSSWGIPPPIGASGGGAIGASGGGAIGAPAAVAGGGVPAGGGGGCGVAYGPPAHTGSDGLLMHAVLVGLVGLADWA
jgi:hypothetical protein